MKLKKNVSFLVVCLCVLFIIYFFAAVRPLGTEIQLKPEWTIDISRVSAESTPEKSIPFKLGQTIGYFTPDGKITAERTFPYKAVISSSYYALYGPDDEAIPFYTPNGTQTGTIPRYGFPFIDEDRVYIFLPGGNSFARCSSDGSQRWLYEGTMPIVTFSSSPAGCAAGFADGSIKAFSPNGQITQSFSPGGSNYSVILGIAISPSGNYIACVSGLDEQRFVLVRKLEAQNKIVLHEYLPGNQTHQVLVKFSNDGKFVCYNYKNGLGIADVEHRTVRHIPLKGNIISIQETDNENISYILSREKDIYTVSVLEAYTNIAGSFSFHADAAFIRTDGNALFIGKNSKISRISVKRD